MDSLNRIVYLSEQQYNTLITSGTLTVNGQVITYNANDLYLTPDISSSAIITDEKVLNTLNTAAKYYITGTSNDTTSTNTQIFDSNIYSTTKPGELSMTSCAFNNAGQEKAYFQYNATDQSIDLIFN